MDSPDTVVTAFVYGDHLHYVGMPPCNSCEEDNRVWDNLISERGLYGTADKVERSKAYKAYLQARPFDFHEPTLSLDSLMEAGYIEPSNTPSITEMLVSDEAVKEFRQTLTPKQRRILDKLLRGYKPKEIYSAEGYLHTGGIRYHKHIIRKKYKEFTDER